jgi:hypothetical protein
VKKWWESSLNTHTVIFMYVPNILYIVLFQSTMHNIYIYIIYFINYRLSRLYKWSHKHITNTNYIVKIKQTTFYQQLQRYILSKFYHQLMQKRIALKGKLKFTLKQLQHASIQSPS